MKILLDPEDIDRMKARLEMVYARRLVSILEEVPLENPNQRVTDAAHRAEWIKRTVTKAEHEHPLPHWRDLL